MIKELWAHFQRFRANRREWRQAKTLSDLSARGALWASGQLGHHPMGYDDPDPETTPLLPVLARANAAGFFTYGSQPGGEWDDEEGHVKQRAFVEGYLERSRVEEFRSYLEGAGLLVLDGLTHDEPLTCVDGQVVTGGRWVSRIDDLMTGLSSSARQELADAASLDVIDLVWGRKDTLWNALDAWAASQA